MKTLVVFLLFINAIFAVAPNAQSREEVQNADSTRPAIRACQSYLQLQANLTKDDEGVTFQYPWMAALGYRDNHRQTEDYFCGGVIISEWYVLTTSNCIRPRDVPVFVRLGTAYLSDKEGIDFANHTIAHITKHPEYSLLSQRNDIALLRLSEPIEFTKNIQPACLHMDTRDEPSDVTLLATGWGSVSRDRFVRSDEIQRFELVTDPLEDCNSTLVNYNIQLNQSPLRNGLNKSQYCAKDPTYYTRPCQGTGGSPLLIFLNNSTTPSVVGLYSFSAGCGAAKLPGVFTRIPHFVSWIEQKVWPTPSDLAA